MQVQLKILIIIIFFGLIFSNQKILSKPFILHQLNNVNYEKQLITNNNNISNSIYIESDEIIVHYPEYILLNGNVNIKQKDSIITADRAKLTQYKEQQKLFNMFDITGNVRFLSKNIILYGNTARYNFSTKDVDIYHGSYQMIGKQGKGIAKIVKQRDNNRYTILEDGSFTSCQNEKSWSIIGSKIIYDHKKQFTSIWNAKFKIGKIPVVYLPYLAIPIKKNNQTGFLTINTKYESYTGLNFSVPYYLHFPHNYNATITPNYMSKQGIQMQSEFHYLNILGNGIIKLNWIAKNETIDYQHSNIKKNHPWLFYLHHKGQINKPWRLNIDYTKISKFNYFDNFVPKYESIIDRYATQKINLTYSNKYIDSSLSYDNFQPLKIINNSNYYTSPKFDITYYKNSIGPFDFQIFTQLVKFENNNTHLPKATRLHIEPEIRLPLVNQWGKLHTKLKLMTTYYQQSNISYYNINNIYGLHLKKTTNRILPQIEADGSVTIVRNTDDNHNYLQTIETKIQEVYVPYKNQNSIGIYDTALQKDYINPFNNTTYNGIDRIPFTNRLICSIITRIYDNYHIERFNTSINHLYNFQMSHKNNALKKRENHRYYFYNSIWTWNNFWRINDKFMACGELQCNLYLDTVLLSNLSFSYRYNENYLFHLNYRYISQKYITYMLSNDEYQLDYQNNISQIGITGKWLLSNHLSINGSCYYDTNTYQMKNQLLGIQYNTYCLGVNINFERKPVSSENISNTIDQYDNKIFFNIKLSNINLK